MHFRTLTLLGTSLIAGPMVTQAQEWTVTATGTVSSDGGSGSSLFAPLGTSLIGDSYTETITTDLTQNGSQNGSIACDTISCYATAGGSGYAVPTQGASYTLTMTINGVTFSQTDSNPVINYGGLIDALSTNDTSRIPYGGFEDGVFQQIASSGCETSGVTTCVQADINASSTTTPFVSSLYFTQSITASSGFDSASQVQFVYWPVGAGDPAINLYGSISELTVNAAPEFDPTSAGSGLVLLVGGLMVLRGRNRQGIAS
jgi:hypothetical protein